MRRWLLLVCALAPACGTEPSAESCAPVCASLATGTATAVAAASGNGVELTAFEAKVLAEQIEDVRGGIRPFDAQGFGVCRGDGKECTPEDFLGLDAGELLAGIYMIRAEALVPRAGELGTWTMKWDLECTTIRTTPDGETRSTSTRSKTFDTMRYSGTERGYRLSPIHRIESPSTTGAQECSYTLTAPNADGDGVWKGSYKVPAAE